MSYASRTFPPDEAQWRTAGILSRPAARRFAGRLSASKIDHTATAEGRCIRISVRTEDLQLALEIRPDQPVSAPIRAKTTFNSKAALRMLASIPGGAFAGKLVSHVYAIDSALLPLGACLLGVLATEATASFLRERRLMNQLRRSPGDGPGGEAT